MIFYEYFIRDFVLSLLMDLCINLLLKLTVVSGRKTAWIHVERKRDILLLLRCIIESFILALPVSVWPPVVCRYTHCLILSFCSSVCFLPWTYPQDSHTISIRKAFSCTTSKIQTKSPGAGKAGKGALLYSTLTLSLISPLLILQDEWILSRVRIRGWPMPAVTTCGGDWAELTQQPLKTRKKE